MKALRFHGRGDLRLDDIADRPVGEGMVQVDVAWCGICGTDVHEYRHGPLAIPVTSPHPLTGETMPVVLGHEFSGVVSAVGSGVESVQVGDRVVIEPLLYCRACDWCRAGDYRLCPLYGAIGLHGMAGGFAERAVVPAYTVHPVPDGVSLEAAAIVEPLAVAWHALDRAGQRPGGSVLVLGAGPVGLATLMAARARGAGSVVVAAHREGARSEAARCVGADAVLDASSMDVHAAVRDLVGGGVDVVVETSGAQEALTAGLASVAPLGTVVSLAVWPEPPRVDVQDLMLREVTLLGSKVYRHGDFAEVLSALADGRLAAPERIVSTRLTLDAAVDRGFAALVDDPAAHVKVLVTPRPSPD